MVAPSFFFSVSEDSSSGQILGLNLLVASPDWDFSRIFSQSFLDSSCCAGKTDEPKTGAQVQIQVTLDKSHHQHSGDLHFSACDSTAINSCSCVELEGGWGA